MNSRAFVLGLLLVAPSFKSACAQDASTPSVVLTAEELRDRIRGGLLGQLLGNLNGLPHELKYIDEPGQVQGYVPALPKGAWTDDDTDFEWVYIVEMQRRNSILLSPEEIATLWKQRINRAIWCSNQYARQLMDIGLTPPLTGRFALNPWADFNISGQFLCETFGLLAPAMPQTAARIGLNYTTVAIDLEPAQTTQLFTAMIATAFVDQDVSNILDAGLAALDPRSVLHEIVGDIRGWHAEHPDDWQTTRRLIKEKYTRHNGEMRDINGFELNTAVTIAALLYGQGGNLVRTIETDFNLGWDCDNSAATAGTIVGVIKGYRWIMSQGWQIVDRYQNTSRDAMPDDETITSFADRLIDLAEKVIVDHGGRRDALDGRPKYVIRAERPVCVQPLPSLDEQFAEMRKSLGSDIENGILNPADETQQSRAAYLAICLGLGENFRRQHPAQWQRAVEALSQHGNVVQAIYYNADVPAGAPLREKASAAGLKKPDTKRKLW